MHRPTRKLKNLRAKIDRKKAASRGRGQKLKRWVKWADTYAPLAKSPKGDSSDS